MTGSKPRIYDMESLDTEIGRLKTRCRQIEDELDSSMDELKDNYRMMAFNSFIGNRLKSLPFLGSIAGAVLGNPKAQAIIQNFLEKIFKGGSGLAEKWIARIFK